MSEVKDDPLVGKPAPDFCLPDAQATSFCLHSFKGKWVVLYFYPRDNTPGCTIEAIQFNAALEKFVDLGAQVIGVSTDSQESHQKFAEKFSLSILLLSNPDHQVIATYDSWKPLTLFGKEMLGTSRDTFLINPEGMITDVWRKVSPKGHPEEVKSVLMKRKEGRYKVKSPGAAPDT
jgi:peroxiredoxin Q/BCP